MFWFRASSTFLCNLLRILKRLRKRLFTFLFILRICSISIVAYIIQYLKEVFLQILKPTHPNTKNVVVFLEHLHKSTTFFIKNLVGTVGFEPTRRFTDTCVSDKSLNRLYTCLYFTIQSFLYRNFYPIFINTTPFNQLS